jgi:osmoprotectant transport system ATP-binding protein
MGDLVAVMRGGRLLQHDRPARLVTHPADPFVATLIGTGERSLRLLSLLNVSDVTRPGIGDGPPVRTTATLRDVLAELVWRGAKTAKVVDDAGSPVGQVSLDDILARGRQAP